MNASINMFEVFPWNKNFETGNAMIDEQHQILVELLNKLASTLVNQNEAELNTAFNELTSYASMHFAEEEKIWTKYFSEDPWLLSHLKTHTSFLPSILEIKNNASTETLPDAIEKIVYYLLHWLIFHIIDSDKRMILAIKALKTGASMDDAKIIANKEMSGSESILLDTILSMYDGVTSRTIALMREMNARKEAEAKLNAANEKLESLIITDPLTGLFNRRHLNNTFKTMLRKAMRDKTSLSYFLIDIDFFKSINDHYGHLTGDHALEQLGSCLIKVCKRPGDIAFRVGGEEFAILTTNKNEADAYQFAEIVRTAVENLKIPNIDSEVSDYMTVSIGGVHKLPHTEDNQDVFARIADKRLYQAKTSGRNKSVISDL